MELKLVDAVTFTGLRILGSDALPSSELLGVAMTISNSIVAEEHDIPPAMKCEKCDAGEAALQRIAAKMPTREQWQKIVKKSRESGAAERQQQLEVDELSS